MENPSTDANWNPVNLQPMELQISQPGIKFDNFMQDTAESQRQNENKVTVKLEMDDSYDWFTDEDTTDNSLGYSVALEPYATGEALERPMVLEWGAYRPQEIKLPETYQCNYCLNTYKSKAFYLLHLNQHGEAPAHFCDVCCGSFESRREMLAHRKCHFSTTTHCCAFCAKTFRLWTMVVQHMEGHINKKCFECKLCSSKFSTGLSLFKHMEVHSESYISRRPFTCCRCKLRFTHHEFLKNHIKRHVRRVLFRCGLCEESFAVRWELYKHVAVHIEDDLFRCIVCSHYFFSEQRLQTHIRNCHSGGCVEVAGVSEAASHGNLDDESHLNHLQVEPPQPDYASQSINWDAPPHPNQSSEIKRKRRTTQKDHHCVFCGKAHKLPYLLYKHMESHMNKKLHKCHICSLIYKTPYLLLRHVMVHDANYVFDRPFLCIKCGFRFSHENILGNHMRLHSKDELFRCSACKLSFTTKTILYKHFIVHIKDKVFQCRDCMRYFATKARLQLHEIKLHHGEIVQHETM